MPRKGGRKRGPKTRNERSHRKSRRIVKGLQQGIREPVTQQEIFIFLTDTRKRIDYRVPESLLLRCTSSPEIRMHDNRLLLTLLVTEVMQSPASAIVTKQGMESRCQSVFDCRLWYELRVNRRMSRRVFRTRERKGCILSMNNNYAPRPLVIQDGVCLKHEEDDDTA